jgi:hypothetical protein
MISLDEGGPLEKVLRKITADTKFRKYCQLGASLLGLRRKAQDASRISCKIADGGIELSESYFHAGTLEYGWNSRIANLRRRSVPLVA